jgi:hypothetical protein
MDHEARRGVLSESRAQSSSCGVSVASISCAFFRSLSHRVHSSFVV